MSIDTINEQIAKLERDKARMLRLAEAEREVADLRRELDGATDTDTDTDTHVEADTEVAVSQADIDVEDEDVAEPAGTPRRARVRVLLAGLIPRRKRSIIAVVTAAVMLIAGATVGVLALNRQDGLPSGVAFQFGGRDITRTQLDAEVQTLQALYGIEAPTAAKALDRFRRSAAKAYAVSLILDKAARARHIIIADKQAQDVLARYLQQQFGDSSDAITKFDAALGQVGTSQKAVLTEIKRQLAITQLFDQVTTGVTVTAAQVAAQFTKTKASLATPEKRDIRNIVVQTEATAQALVTQLAAGANFTKLATTYSLDSATNKAGGELGLVQASDLDAAYAKVAFAAVVGAPFGPIKTQSGWNIGVVTKTAPATPAVYSKVKQALHDQMVLDRKLTIWRTWLGGEIRHADVQYAAAYLPSDPNAPPSSQPGTPDVASATPTATHS